MAYYNNAYRSVLSNYLTWTNAFVDGEFSHEVVIKSNLVLKADIAIVGYDPATTFDTIEWFKENHPMIKIVIALCLEDKDKVEFSRLFLCGIKNLFYKTGTKRSEILRLSFVHIEEKGMYRSWVKKNEIIKTFFKYR